MKILIDYSDLKCLIFHFSYILNKYVIYNYIQYLEKNPIFFQKFKFYILNLLGSYIQIF